MEVRVKPVTMRSLYPGNPFVVKNRFLLLAVLICGLPASASAYVDPGSGMLLWQGLIAAIGAVLVFVRSPWQALKRVVERLRRK